MNFYHDDPNLARLLKQYLDPLFFDWAEKELAEFGEMCAGEIDERATHTDREGQPKLIKYNRYGEDVSRVWVNEGYFKTVEQVYNKGIVGYVHKPIPALGQKGNYVYAFAQGYLLSQSELGFYCPVTLTAAASYLLDHYGSHELKQTYLPQLISTGEAERYEGATFLTERQGGSDVGANETKAVSEDGCYRLYGEKYFASNVGMCGVAMVLARREGAPSGTKGLSLFLVPWEKENGEKNGIYIRRLKDKLGVRAVPSGEVVFDGAKAYLVGDPRKGFYYMMEALNLSRICNAVASIGIMRRAYREARAYALRRTAFGSRLADYPMVKETLVKMAAKQEVETSAVFRLATLFDRTASGKADEKENIMARLLIAILKMETAEQAIHFAHEAIEMHGGNGYIEDFVTPRLLRDAQVLTVWEGTANILGLEVLRLMRKFKVHDIFIGMMREKIDQLQAGTWLSAGLEQLEETCRFVMKAKEEAVQTYHCKKVARQMVKIYESVTALEDALAGQRQKWIAEAYLRLAWHDPLAIDPELALVKHFEEIVMEKVPANEGN
ncbi:MULTISPECIES: acyl-CoA dehydrogenase family protein [Heyndrickxia]|uniref:Acyl-CoA dehydrogenase domain-containing protein n=2 Tax=Heyndrickxia coagulans TaxID=1398 RepID=G2TQI1_HEYCO|nr:MULTISPECIES: acyl-CoA dehydrogenase family protein [Heyndrickxia]AEO99829.1 acyl-CoA dehydrogenase domain-containing protein [Heyndrickxia coagulans 36D1]KWZ77829.1 acyl-CoA dehydrogenase protein [Heyndrickxia coagulans]MEC2304364.1 acyl-CoA dehydrogenase family protein [Weizmannia sp. CD-2023]MEC2342261.1 acyl-CoA dehydrogenase family protein [Weizmannia sp. CD-2023]